MSPETESVLDFRIKAMFATGARRTVANHPTPKYTLGKERLVPAFGIRPGNTADDDNENVSTVGAVTTSGVQNVMTAVQVLMTIFERHVDVQLHKPPLI